MRKKFFLHLAAIVAGVVVLSACAGEELRLTRVVDNNDVIGNLWVSSTVSDNLGGSEAVIVESSTISVGSEVSNYQPTAYLNVELDKENIQVSSIDSIPVELVGEETVSENDFAEGNTLGKDIVKKFTYSDGQIATVKYGWRYDRVALDGETLNAPHMEITMVNYSDFVSEQTSDDLYKVTLEFTAKWVSNGATPEQSGDIALRPYYNKSVVEKDVAGEPIWTTDLIWNEDGTVTAKVTKTTPHTLAEPEVEVWEHPVTVVMGKNRDNSWYVGDNSVHYENKETLEEGGSYDAGFFTVTTSAKRYDFSPFYRMPNGQYLTPTPDFMIRVFAFDIVFEKADEGKRFEFKIDIDLKFTQEMKNLPERAALYPDDTYLGSDVKEFSYVDSATGREVLHHTSYTDLKLHP